MIESKFDNSNNMDDSAKITLIMDIIKRYDNYIASTNAKASLIIALNTLILGTILLKFGEIISFYCSLMVRDVVGILLALIAASSLLSLFFVFSVVYPYFGGKSDNERQESSIIYFGCVAEMNCLEYLEKLNSLTIDKLIADLAEQASILACGLMKKMLMMRHSIEAIMFSLVLILALVIMKAAN